jgi:uncharacterized protein DUF4846
MFRTGNGLLTSHIVPSRESKKSSNGAVPRNRVCLFRHSVIANPIKLDDLEIGDMFVKGGSPGHAMIAIGAAIDQSGQKIFVLAQGYMPA